MILIPKKCFHMCRFYTSKWAKKAFWILKSKLRANISIWCASVQYCELIPFLRYTLLIGRPPFETNSLKETYSRIKKCEYKIPSTSQISNSAIKIIQATLQPDPKCRPKVEELLNSEFLTSGTYLGIYLSKENVSHINDHKCVSSCMDV